MRRRPTWGPQRLITDEEIVEMFIEVIRKAEELQEIEKKIKKSEN